MEIYRHMSATFQPLLASPDLHMEIASRIDDVRCGLRWERLGQGILLHNIYKLNQNQTEFPLSNLHTYRTLIIPK